MAEIWTARARKLMQWACLGTSAGIIGAILIWPVLTRASNPALLCETAARNASQRHGVPLDVLRAVALVETGRARNGRMEPWPWAVNLGGPGAWPDTRKAALKLARDQRDLGQRNFDLGCFQVNYRWHGHNFSSLDDMIDPEKNADYAARLLRKHKAQRGSWDSAAGAYHSATPALAARYIARFRSLRGQTAPPLPVQTATTPPARDNNFTLLQAGGEQSMGSLVPISTRGASQPLIQLGPPR